MPHEQDNIHDVASQRPRGYRVALLGIYHESNTFIPVPTTIRDFEKGHSLRGVDIIKEYRHAFHEIGGMLSVLDAAQTEIVPIIFAEATPGGIIKKEAYEQLIAEMFLLLKKQLPVDACLVVPHGAGVAEGYEDMDGHWLSELRKIVGDTIPIAGTLDPHANVSQLMVDATDALIAYRTNPHIDQRETGARAATLLLQMLRKEVFPVQLLVPTPIAISIEQQLTSSEPCNILLTAAGKIEAEAHVYAVSLLLGFPYADVVEMGTSFIVIADRRHLSATALLRKGNEMRNLLIALKNQCKGTLQSIETILPSLEDKEKPVLLLDMGDNVGGGAPGDGIYLLDAIESFGRYRSLHCVYDPAAVQLATSHESGDAFPLDFGNASLAQGALPLKGVVTVINKGNGTFTEHTPRHGGQVHFDMGAIAVIKTAKGSTILLHSLRVPPFSVRQITTFGIDPSGFDIIVAKGVNAPVAAYSSICPTMIQVNTPGVTTAAITQLVYHKRRRPLFPFEDF